MEIPIYLALFSSEFLTCPELPQNPAWMACHFSYAGSGLTNIPASLPAGSVLIVDDSIPYLQHDCDLILSQLSDAVSLLRPAAVLLDFQRPNIPEVQLLADLLTKRLPCPVVVSACYAASLDCPIFLPPAPIYLPVAEYLQPYQDREIWVDCAPICGKFVVTAESSQYTSQANTPIDKSWHCDTALHCHYRTQIEENRITFSLARTCDDLSAWLKEASQLGVSCAVGLYQELKNILI